MGFTRRSIVQVDCKRNPEQMCEQLRDAYLTLENRIGEQINEEGVFTGNLPKGVKVPGCDGQLHDITQMASSQIQLENEGWEQKTNLRVFESPPGTGIFNPEAICMNPAGTLFIEIQDGASSGTVNVWPALNYEITGDPITDSPIGTVTAASLDLPNFRTTFTDDGNFLLLMSQGAGRQVVSIDLRNPTLPVVADVLNVNSNTQTVWRDILWDEGNKVLWFCDGSIFDRIVGAQLDGDGNMTLIEYIDAANINRAQCLDLSDNGNFIYCGSRGRIVVIDITNLGAISTSGTFFTPGGGSEDLRYVAHQGTNMAFATNITTPATIYSATIDAPQTGLTFNNSIQMSVGDNLGSNQGYTLSGVLWGLITLPESASGTKLMLFDISAPTPIEVEVVEMNVGNVQSRYYAPAANVWETYITPPGQPNFDTFVQKWSSGTVWGDPADQDQCYQFNAWQGAYFESGAPQGVPPFIVHSTTLVENLNADLLDGLHASEIIDQAVSRSHDEWLFWERLNTP